MSPFLKHSSLSAPVRTQKNARVSRCLFSGYIRAGELRNSAPMDRNMPSPHAPLHHILWHINAFHTADIQMSSRRGNKSICRNSHTAMSLVSRNHQLCMRNLCISRQRTSCIGRKAQAYLRRHRDWVSYGVYSLETAAQTERCVVQL